jgi:hypothetical protein
LRGSLESYTLLTPAAYDIFCNEILNVIRETWPDEVPEKLPYVIPAWDDVEAWWAKQTLEIGRQDFIRHE